MPVNYLDKWCELVFERYPEISTTLEQFKKGKRRKSFETDLHSISVLLTEIYQSGLMTEKEREKALSTIQKMLSNKKVSDVELDLLLDFVDSYVYKMDSIVDKIGKSSKQFSNVLPEEYRIEVENVSTRLLSLMDKFSEKDIARNYKLIKDFILSSNVGMNISSIARHLSDKYGSDGFHVSTVWKIVELLELEKREVITRGGRRRGFRDRLCYPNLMNIPDRNLRDGKEDIIQGMAEENLFDYLEFKKAAIFGLHVYKFNTNYNPDVFLIAATEVPKNIEIKSIGTFYKGNLELHLKEKFRVTLKDHGKKYANDDSLIAYVVWDEEDNVLWLDKTNFRAKELARIV